MTRIQALACIDRLARGLPLVSTCGATSRELSHLGRRPNHYYVVDAMGLCPSIGVGLALALQDSAIPRVVVVEGDGGALMNPNALGSAAFLQPEKLILIVLDNGCYASTGGQRAPSQVIDIGRLAAGYGLRVVVAADPVALEAGLTRTLREPGPWLVHTRIAPGNQPGCAIIRDDPAVLTARFQAFLRGAPAAAQESGP
jgi:thiamine pyrophosphate-dependent acetolactate synthase large subunit-like protein